MDELLAPVLDAVGLRNAAVEVVGAGTLPSVFRVSDLAVATVAAAGASLAALTGSSAPVVVDRGLAGHWFGMSIRPDGWQLPPVWDAVAGDYRSGDGWIRLHTNAAHHRAAALAVLGVPAERSAVEAAVRKWPATELQEAVVAAGGAAAAMQDAQSWAQHPQGRKVRTEPLIAAEPGDAAEPFEVAAGERPLAGVRVLDLTRVLAGPVATRLLAGWGARVLRLDPPDWDEPGVIPEMLLGKRTARLDLRTAEGRERFASLLAGADILVHGYRADALDRLGFGTGVRRQLRPGLVDVALDAYGWTGPWRGRRGFDSLVQMSTGIAEEGMRAYGRDRPTPLPVQAIDHATGYLLAAAALRGLLLRRDSARGSRWRLSLARTSQLLLDAGRADTTVDDALAEPELEDRLEQTSWGPARRVRAPLTVAGAPLRWELPARALGSDEPSW